MLPKKVHIIEVGPRDGLQIENQHLTVPQKLTLIRSLEAAGLNEIEIGSFVNPKAVPQMANSRELAKEIESDKNSNTTYRALWLNARGLTEALAFKALTIEGRLTITASEAFIKRNTNRSIDEAFAEMEKWITLYKSHGIEPDAVGVMAAFGCNFEGDIHPQKVVDLIARTADILAAHGSQLRSVRLSDTMGWAGPLHVKRLVGAVRTKWPELQLKLHFHDTRGAALANAYAAMEEGVDTFDSSIGGIGGCPFAGYRSQNQKTDVRTVPPAGNMCTEDFACLSEEMGIDTGLDIPKLIDAARLAEEMLQRALPSKMLRATPLITQRAKISTAMPA